MRLRARDSLSAVVRSDKNRTTTITSSSSSSSSSTFHQSWWSTSRSRNSARLDKDPKHPKHPNHPKQSSTMTMAAVARLLLLSVTSVYFVASSLYLGMQLENPSSSLMNMKMMMMPSMVVLPSTSTMKQPSQDDDWKEHWVQLSQRLDQGEDDGNNNNNHHNKADTEDGNDSNHHHRVLLRHQKPVTAYLEAPLLGRTTTSTTSTNTTLPLRTQRPEQLQKVVYPAIQSCRNVPAQWPIDDHRPNVVGDQLTPPLDEMTPHCPVDADPFLPWIHDVFLSYDDDDDNDDSHHQSNDGRWVVQFIAQNKRRCQTGPQHVEDLRRLEPQVALLQSVPLQRISHSRAVALAPELWHPTTTTTNTTTTAKASGGAGASTVADAAAMDDDETTTTTTPRYRLVPYEQADADAMYTRFICRFHTWSMEAATDATTNDAGDTTTTTASSSDRYRLELGETLSEYPLNYELAAYRKHSSHRGGLLTRHGTDNGKFWTSTLLFSCPLPAVLQPMQTKRSPNNNKKKKKQDETTTLPPQQQQQQWVSPRLQIPLVHVDVIPIRTPVRLPQHDKGDDNDSKQDDGDNANDKKKDAASSLLFDKGFYLSTDQIGPELVTTTQTFDPRRVWGEEGHVLPLPQASGRWENIPVCPLATTTTTTATTSRTRTTGSSTVTTTTTTTAATTSSVEHGNPPNHTTTTAQSPNHHHTKKKPYLLSACLWAAASFHTRGKNKPQHLIDNTQQRLQEWIEFHLLVGIDHIYVYDNSGAFSGNRSSSSSSSSSTTNLKSVVETFPSQVTWIDWPSQVCNNNIPGHENAGERSSQYAAENSCRTRYGSTTEWIASFDTDEYLVPMNLHTSLRTVVQQAEAAGTNILSFPSSRGKLRHAYSESVSKGGRSRGENITFLQAFNCDGSPTPRPSWAIRARKQLYRPDYVLNHFVHYSTVTKGLMTTYQEAQRKNESWTRYYSESSPSERSVDEVNEAIMIHTKSLDRSQTQNFQNKCRFDFTKKFLGCFVGFPWPNNTVSTTNTYDPATGWEYNCFVNERVDSYWTPRLQDAMARRKQVSKRS